MAEINEQYLPDEPEKNLNDVENDVHPTRDPDLLSTKDVARILCVCEKTALSIMKELPHICISQNLLSARKRILITVQTLNDFLEGRIERKPYEDMEEEPNDVD